MNIEFLPEKVEKLESVFLNILYLKPEDRLVSPDIHILNDLKDVLNSIFDTNKCINIVYTLNTDKQFFGIRINPNMSPADATIILSSDERVKLNKYQIEFDSKLFGMGLTSEELTAITIFEIASIMDTPEIFDRLRATIDSTIVKSDDVINIRDSVNYAQLIIFALKDTLSKLGSMLYKEDKDELRSIAIQSTNLEDYIISAKDKISSNITGMSDSFRTARPVILQWMFVMYKDYRTNNQIITDTLRDAKVFAASKLDIDEINKTLASIDRLNGNITAVGEGISLNKFFDAAHISVVNEISLFKNLKKNGLRGIENELYEYSMRVKNCTEAEDAYMIMRGINSRLRRLSY